jgi:SAM-dependent methyltransferase
MAESFGVDPERYDRARPRYPEALVNRIVAVSPGPEFLDVGCGTGIEARQFQAAGRTVLGVEPDERMAAYARTTGVDVEVSTFEAWDPAGRTFDAVVAGTAWHWVDPVVGAAKAAQVLRPGGRLAVFWHVFQQPPEVATAFATAFQRVFPDSPINFQSLPKNAMDIYAPGFDKATEGIGQAGAFGPVERWPFEWVHVYGRDEWLDQMLTQGTLTQAPPDKAAEVQAEVGAAIDALGGSVRMQYTTVAVTAARV